MPADLENSGHRTGKGQFSFQSQRRAMPKNAQTTAQLHSSHTLAKECSNFSKSGFNSMWAKNFQMFKLDLEKTEEPEIKFPTSIGSSKKQENSRKTSTSVSLIIPKCVCRSQQTGKFLKRWKYQTTLAASWEICIACQETTIRTGHGTTDWFQIGKGVCQGCILSPCLFNLYAVYIMGNVGWMKHKLESRLPGEISITTDTQMAPPLWQKVRKN